MPLPDFRAFVRRGHAEQPIVSARHVADSRICSMDDFGPLPDRGLIELALAASSAALDTDVSWLADRCSDAEEARFVMTWPGEHYRLLAALAQVTQARHVVEIGTYTGLGTLALASAGAHVVTFDILPWRTFPSTVLREADFDGPIEQRIADLSVPAVFSEHADVLRSADLIFCDGPKDGAFEPVFASLLYPAIADSEAIVVWDDIRVLSMLQLWRDLPVPKLDLTSFGHWSGTGLTRARAARS